jgi:two-component system, NarL family, response regulator DevR
VTSRGWHGPVSSRTTVGMDSYVPRYCRVYLLDDHDIVRRGLRDLLVGANDIDVVGDSGSVREAIPDILRLETDVMLLDLQLQDGSGVEACRAVRAAEPSVQGLLLTGSGDDEALAAAVLAGAAGHLVKLSRSTDIVGAIRKVRAGSSLVDAAGVRRATRLLGSIAEALTPPLTDDELRILERMIGGDTDSQIARDLTSDHVDPGGDLRDLVARLTPALVGHGSASRGSGGGRHRRPD